MKHTAAFYWKLFYSTFTISAFTFGGGFVIIPMMKAKFVDEYHWLDETEVLDLVAIAQCSPGALAVNASILMGYRLAGVFGAALTVAATIMPPLIIISLISLCYEAFRDNTYVSMVLKGMQAGVAAVIASVVIQMGGAILKQKRVIPIVIMLGVVAAAAILKVNVMLIILVCGVIGAVDLLVIAPRKEGSV